MLSTILHAFTAFVAAHPGAVAWLTATGLAVYRTRTPAQWVALGESEVRLQGLFKMARGAGFEPARVLEGAAQVVTGQRVPDPRELVIASQAEELTRLREALAALQRRVSESQGVAHPAQLFAPTFDAGQRQTIAPEVVAAAREATRDGQRGHTSLSAALAAVALIGIVGAVGLMVMGCPVSQQLTRPALGPVDGCEPRSTRCAPDGRPQVCSGSRRWTDADVACVTAGQVAAVCCLTTSPITGRELHACVLAERCLPVDGGAR